MKELNNINLKNNGTLTKVLDEESNKLIYIVSNTNAGHTKSSISVIDNTTINNNGDKIKDEDIIVVISSMIDNININTQFSKVNLFHDIKGLYPNISDDKLDCILMLTICKSISDGKVKVQCFNTDPESIIYRRIANKDSEQYSDKMAEDAVVKCGCDIIDSMPIGTVFSIEILSSYIAIHLPDKYKNEVDNSIMLPIIKCMNDGKLMINKSLISPEWNTYKRINRKRPDKPQVVNIEAK